MKKLSEVTKDDAVKILDAYSVMLRTGRWKLEDTTAEMREPSKKLSCARKAYLFWFFDDKKIGRASGRERV